MKLFSADSLISNLCSCQESSFIYILELLSLESKKLILKCSMNLALLSLFISFIPNT